MSYGFYLVYFMKNTLLVSIIYLQSCWASAGFITVFKDEQGKTNWQHLANWSSGTLILLLSIVSVYLFVARRHAHQANRELTAIRSNLENRVKERTATLDQSNQLLQESNQLLAEEVAQHVITADQLRASEAYVTNILTSMPLMLVGLDKDGRVTKWNKQVEEVSGIPPEQALGKTLWEAYPQMTVLPEHIQQAIEHNQIIHLKQCLRSIYHYDVTIYPLQGTEAGVVILVDDVTKQTSAENMLIHNDKMSFMGELASTMAHDISLPLRAIMMDMKRFQNILAENGSSTLPVTDNQQVQRLSDILADMSAKGEQVSSIISNLLAFARSRSGNKQTVNVVDVIENTISLANEVITTSDGLNFSQVLLERKFDKNLPLVPCYITELQQVFLSLFRHACYSLDQRTGDEGFVPTIKIILSECYDNFWIKIQHNGVGLTSDEQMYLFEPFFTNKSSADGFDAGQRLSFSYYIIAEQHQGHMAVTSDLELGSTFHIQLPIVH